MRNTHYRGPCRPAFATLSLALMAALCAPLAAHASGSQLTENTAMGLGRAYAGSAAAPGDCSVVVNNPAAMSEFNAPCLQADLTAINFGAQFHGNGSDATGAALTGGNGGNAGQTMPVPADHFILPINDRFAIGAAVTVPFGFELNYASNWAGRYEAQKTEVQSPALTFSGSWKLNDDVSIGASVIAQRTSSEQIQAIDFGAMAGMPQVADGQVKMKGFVWSWGYDLGLLWKPTSSDRLGVNFHSQVVNHIDNSVHFTVPQGLLPMFGGAFVNTTGTSTLNTPAFASASWWHTFSDRFSLGADVRYTHWSSLQQVNVSYANPAQVPFSAPQMLGFKNAWFASVGGDYRLTDQWTLRGGLAYDETPTVNVYRSPNLPDGSRRWVTVGVGYQPSERLRFDLGYAHVFANRAPINNLTGTLDSLTGSFDIYANLLSVSAQLSF